ncbi:MAG: phytase [Candidatus Devosia phytovorans]|uniref:Phytase n=1 Tax=Candidatus Devosia phytovorans TaxID=3121372 RepID=A0AAJ5VRW4_9HYPH|nr:phytase [Devosia sp.]WEK03554.1 MAG: phytase [Devosia sp.]
MTRLTSLLVAALLAGTALPTHAQTVADVAPTLQTPILTEEDADADADDPTIYVNADDAAKSLVVTAVKNGGIRVYGLDGALIQTILPAEDGRINNVDIVYGFVLDDGSKADLIIGADRGLDIIRAWRIDPAVAEPLSEITDPSASRAFPQRYSNDGATTEDNPVDDQNTVYGLAAWNDKASGTTWIVGTQRHQPTVGIFKLAATANGHVAATLDHDFRVPTTHDGQDLWIENEDDPLLDFSPQFEGTVIDRTTGTIYAGQEDVGIWTVSVTGGEPVLAYATRGSSASPFNNPDSVISRDVEGLSIYYAASGTKYLIASSQGGAHGDAPSPDAPYDDSFAAFDITDGMTLLGAFRVSASGDMDAVQESDGADVISLGLPGFENGLFITQDGYAGDLNGLDGEVASTNFKFVDWKAIADSFEPKLEVTPEGFDPRQ